MQMLLSQSCSSHAIAVPRNPQPLQDPRVQQPPPSSDVGNKQTYIDPAHGPGSLPLPKKRQTAQLSVLLQGLTGCKFMASFSPLLSALSSGVLGGGRSPSAVACLHPSGPAQLQAGGTTRCLRWARNSILRAETPTSSSYKGTLGDAVCSLSQSRGQATLAPLCRALHVATTRRGALYSVACA